MSDSTNNVKVDEPSNTQAQTATEDVAMIDAAPKVDDAVAADTKVEGDAKAEGETKSEDATMTEGNAKSEDVAKTEGDAKSEDVKEAEDRNGHQKSKQNFKYSKNQNKKFDPSLAPLDPTKTADQVRKQVRQQTMC